MNVKDPKIKYFEAEEELVVKIVIIGENGNGNPDEDVSILHRTNTIRKGMNLIILSLAMSN